MVKLLAREEKPSLDSIFHALSDSTRRSILYSVSMGEQTVTEVARPYDMSLAAVSKHLNVLEKARLISREKRGSFQFVRLNAEPMKEAEQWLAFYERFWDERLDALKTFLENEDEEQASS